MTKVIAYAALVSLSCVQFGCSSDDTSGGGGEDRGEAILMLTGESAAGATVFEAEGCSNSVCHGADGDSGAAADLSATTLSDEGLVTAILEGAGTMPAFDSLSDQEVADVLAFIRGE